METGVQIRNIVVIFVCLTVLGFLICIASLGSVSAEPADPDFYYYYCARKIPLTLSTEKLAVRFNEGLTIEEQKAVVESEQGLELFSQREECPTFRLVILPLLKGATEEYVIQTIKRLNSRAEVEGAFPVFVIPHSEIVSTDEFIVKFAPDVSKADIDAFNTLNGVEIEDKIEGIEHYILRVKDPKNINTLKMANLYSENPITIFSVFNYIVRTKDAPAVPNDGYFEEQWPLDNTGFNSGETPGTLDADIDAPKGWEISTGSSDIVIAVLDTGVDLAHEDLVNKLVDGYDAFDEDEDPSPGAHWANAHGTACAGLAAAETDNLIGIAGVGWDCRLMPIRVDHSDDNGMWWFSPESFIRGIDWATDNGADVLSCSVPELGDNPNPAVQDAIRRAKNDGREGRGCVIVIAAHNYNRGLRFPSAYPEVIAVGATDDNDERWAIGPGNGSNFGPPLDVVAPTGWDLWDDAIMWTTDISGGDGYNAGGDESRGDIDGDYYKWFGGTSAATPEVAGLAGLILSVNPDLTADEVQFIIESTADDVDESGGWDEEYGWGRINNERALLEAVEFPTDDTLVGWWKFDEGEETTAYDSAGDNDGTLREAPEDPAWLEDPIRGWCLDFDVDVDEIDYVSLSPIGALVTDTVTISAWIYADNLPVGAHTILTQYNASHEGYYFYVKNDRPALYLEGSEAESEDAIDTQEPDWHHIAGTYDGSNLRIYVDGVLKNTSEDLSGETGVHTDTYIGWNFDGKIDDVRVYNWALDLFEIWDAMSGDTSRFRIKNSSDETVAWFDDYGNLFLEGSLEENSDFDPPTGHDEFVVKDSSNVIVAIIDTTDGEMYIDGTLKLDSQGNWVAPTDGDDNFRIQNSGGNDVAYISKTGDLYLKGILVENPE